MDDKVYGVWDATQINGVFDMRNTFQYNPKTIDDKDALKHTVDGFIDDAKDQFGVEVNPFDMRVSGGEYDNGTREFQVWWAPEPESMQIYGGRNDGAVIDLPSVYLPEIVLYVDGDTVTPYMQEGEPDENIKPKIHKYDPVRWSERHRRFMYARVEVLD